MRALIFAVFVLGCLAGSPGLAKEARGRANPLYQPAGPRQEHVLDRARALAARKDHAGAVAAYDALIAAQPQFAKAVAERAFQREAVGDLAGAMSDHDAVLRLTPDSANAWSNAGWIRALRGGAGSGPGLQRQGGGPGRGHQSARHARLRPFPARRVRLGARRL